MKFVSLNFNQTRQSSPVYQPSLKLKPKERSPIPSPLLKRTEAAIEQTWTQEASLRLDRALAIAEASDPTVFACVAIGQKLGGGR